MTPQEKDAVPALSFVIVALFIEENVKCHSLHFNTVRIRQNLESYAWAARQVT